MFCQNCGATLTESSNFCPYCGQALTDTTTSISLMNKAVSVATESDAYSLVLVSTGTCDKTTAGDLLEDIFGYTDAESGNLIQMAPVVVGERLTATEAQTVAQLLTEYGIQVSITNQNDQYVDLTKNATSTVFDNTGKLIAGAAAIIGALTVRNRIKSYRRYKKPSLLERLFRVNYTPAPPVYHRNFRPALNHPPVEPRRTIRKPAPAPQPRRNSPSAPHGGSRRGQGGHGGRR